MTLFKRGLAMNFSKKTFAVTGLALAVSLAGCSSDNPDSGTNISKSPISGIAVDGYIAVATVYLDNNNDGRKSAGEPFAITDKDGYFSTSKLNDVTGETIDYCSSDATSLQQKHCLRAAELQTGAVVRTFGGYDVFTGEPFEGSLAARVTVGEDGVVANQMISPLTSAMVDVSDVQRDSVLTALGLGSDSLDTDFLNSAEFDALTVNRALKLHKVVALLSEAFSEQYDAFGNERSFPETPNPIVYKALAAAIVDEGDLNADAIDAAFLAAQAEIDALYNSDEELTSPGNADGTAEIANAKSILAVVDGAIPLDTDSTEAKSRVMGIETVVKKMIDGDADVTGAAAEASDPTSDMYTKIEEALVAGDVDFIALTDVNYTLPMPDYSDIAVQGGDSFANLQNKQLYISFSQGGKNGSGYFFFNSEDGAAGGELRLCLGYDDGVDGEPEFEETDGVLMSGEWLALDDSRLILSLAGSLSLNLTDRGTNSEMKKRYTLNYGDQTVSWLSDDGILDEATPSKLVEQPTSHASCATLLAQSNNDPV